MNITERFIRYARIGTQSLPDQKTTPSTEHQFELAELLVQELTELGLENPHVDEHCYVYAWLPATPGMEQVPTLGLIAHVDTSDAVPGAPVRPRIVPFMGTPIPLNPKLTLVPEQKYRGQKLIVTDGKTLLGADDKAGVAEIVTACEFLLQHPELAHGRIAVCFTPDEEIGDGTKYFDLDKFGAETAYTVDGGALGEVEYENFNAASCRVEIYGVNVHPGSAKNVMKNAILIASEFIGLLPPAETPAHTEGYEGFYHVNGISGNEHRTTLNLIIRDFDKASFNARKKLVHTAAEFLNARYGQGTVRPTITDSYANMKEQILPHMDLIDNAVSAMKECGVEANIVPIRGGTDGARLSWLGLPCPNLSTGGENFHSLSEYIPVPSLEKMVQVLVKLVCMQK